MLLVALAFQIQHLVKAIGAPSVYTAAETPSVQAATGTAEWQQELMLLGLATTSDPSATSENDPIAMIGPVVMAQLVGQYAGLVENGSYDEASGAAAAEAIAPNVRAAISYKTYAPSDFKTDTDISYERMLVYRSDLREATAPLLKNTESELEIYAKFVETSDASHLEKLPLAAANYREAAKNTAALTIPRDAVNYHRDILNAMEQFAATLEAMTKNPDDAFASVALLRSYNAAEQKMFLSFDALSNYYSQKLPS
ncbi:MAG: hypothetical protein Athens041674_671 [Parcubacteria group bacterium Athens0416_74]|nr:MAG: hypothetical protein Athens041674_671 [Parcubacteria group bacterium Athens0416_74]